jgi:ethanolamine utilization protein EutN
LFLARIDGSLTATVKHKSLEGQRLLIAQRLGADGTDVGEPLVVLDPMGARAGSTVLVTSDGAFAQTLLGDKSSPSRMVVLGLVDETSGTGSGRPRVGDRR